MKVFWSWQADTPGRTGRHFVRAALADAIKVLKQPAEIEEPRERDAREALHLDHDRQGVPGSPDLAPTIFRKIDQSTVFVADVTLVGCIQGEGSAGSPAKKLINSNVAIEYGYAPHALGDRSILTVQNVHYGEREELPFDLKHKAGPVQFRLPRDAPKSQISAASAKLRGDFVNALRPYVSSGLTTIEPRRKFEETPSTTSIAFFWDPPNEVLATTKVPSESSTGRDVTLEYRFGEPRAFYLRLIPTVPLAKPLRGTALVDLVERRRVEVLTRISGPMPSGNRFGAIAYEARGTSTALRAFTQLFRNGEIWGISSQFAHHETLLHGSASGRSDPMPSGSHAMRT